MYCSPPPKEQRPLLEPCSHDYEPQFLSYAGGFNSARRSKHMPPARLPGVKVDRNIGLRPRIYLRFLPRKSIVRCHASSADFGSYLSMSSFFVSAVSLAKACFAL
jgi:hypothetical protein